MIRRLLPALGALALLSGAALAADCPGNPHALGTSRVLVVDPAEHVRLGTMQYHETLPLADKEVVLTFDDGPLPPYSNRVLEILASECVRATYFLVGRMAQAYPDMARHVREAGHTIGTHSQTHPLIFDRMPLARVEQEIDDGIASVRGVLGDANAVAPFFRIPGLARADGVERSLAARSLMTWSADFPADDWRHIRASEIIRRALMRLEAKGKGILLLHDIQPATVIALPTLLKELKARGYRIVHVVPAGPESTKTATEPGQWTLRGRIKVASAEQGWPRVPETSVAAQSELLAAPDAESFDVARKLTANPMGMRAVPRPAIPMQPELIWPRVAAITMADEDPALPVPSLQTVSAVPGLSQAAALAPDAAFPSIPVRTRIASTHKDKEPTVSTRVRQRLAVAHATAARTPPRTILDLLMRRQETPPPRAKVRAVSRLTPAPYQPEPELR